MAPRALSLVVAAAALFAASPGGISLASGAALTSDPPTLRYIAGGSPGSRDPGEFRVVGLPREALAQISRDSVNLSPLLRVRACPAPCGDDVEQTLPDLWGRVTIEDGTVVFRPRHAVNAGVELIARFDGTAFDRLRGASSALTPSLDLREWVPLSPGPAPRVVGIFPSGESVPENLLRIYVEFSASMSVRDVEKQVHLLDASGAEIPLAFVDVPGGLWNNGRTRLTLFLHPGRVKEGVAPHDAMGPVLKEGHTVRIRIDALARDGEGRALGVDAGRAWRVGPAQREAIDPARWRLGAPLSPEAPLVVSFESILDAALAPGALRVVDEDGAPVLGVSRLEDGETRLAFTPQGAWKAGATYRLLIDPVLEDVSGNRTDRPFERAAGATSEEGARPSPLELRFQAPAP